MKKFFSGFFLVTTAILSSCIQNEPMNAECDIEVAKITKVDNKEENSKDLVYNESECIKEIASSDSIITFRLPAYFNNDDLLKEVSLEFAITEGATIFPQNGSKQDFSEGKVVKYTVTSEDKQWHRNYYAQFISIEKEELHTKFSF